MTQPNKPDYSVQQLQFRKQLANTSCASFILMRHGDYHQRVDSPSALQPWPLTNEGQEQAKQAAAEILRWCKRGQTNAQNGQLLTLPNHVHSSTSLRAWQTAKLVIETIEKSTGHTPVINQTDALCERSIGGLANLSIQQIIEAVCKDPRAPALPSDWKAQPDFILPTQGAESLNQAGIRVAQYIVEILAAAPAGETVIFVGHGASIRHAMVHLGLIDARDLPSLSMYHCRPMRWQRIGTNATWMLTDGEWKIRRRTKGLD